MKHNNKQSAAAPEPYFPRILIWFCFAVTGWKKLQVACFCRSSSTYHHTKTGTSFATNKNITWLKRNVIFRKTRCIQGRCRDRNDVEAYVSSRRESSRPCRSIRRLICGNQVSHAFTDLQIHSISRRASKFEQTHCSPTVMYIEKNRTSRLWPSIWIPCVTGLQSSYGQLLIGYRQRTSTLQKSTSNYFMSVSFHIMQFVHFTFLFQSLTPSSLASLAVSFCPFKKLVKLKNLAMPNRVKFLASLKFLENWDGGNHDINWLHNYFKGLCLRHHV